MSAPAAWPVSVFGDEIADPLEEQLEAMLRRGVRHLELRAAWGTNVVDLDAQQLARAKALLREAGVTISAIGSPVGKSPIEAPFEAEQQRFERALAVAEQLGTRLIRVFSFFIPDGRYREHRDEVLRRMALLAERAAARGLVLVHENESYIYGDNADRCLEIMQAAASQALRMAFDPANFVQVGEEPLAAYHRLAGFVAHFHVKDAVPVDRTGIAAYPAPPPEGRLGDSVRPAGQGAGRLPELLAELGARGYDGFLTIEPHLAHRFADRAGADRFEIALDALQDVLRAISKGG